MDPVILPRSEHRISRANIDKDALKVLYRLHQAGFLGYLVGGSVRDLLLGRRPKDFDVVTDARPQQIKHLFRNAFLVGRRFRLVHVIFRDQYIETSTFRKCPQPECDCGLQGHENNSIPDDNENDTNPQNVGSHKKSRDGDPNFQNDGRDSGFQEKDDDSGFQDSENDSASSNDGETADLLLRRENEFGTPYEDASRRDFTINGLFYNIADFSVIDYVGGLEDLKTRTLRCIGDPRVRFQEDPVRMIRAARICGRTEFKPAPDVLDAIHEFRDHVLRCAKARNLEEIFQLLRYNAAEPSIRLMRDMGLMEIMLPEILDHWTDPVKEQRAARILSMLDSCRSKTFPRTPSLMLAALFYPVIEEATEGFQSSEELRLQVEKTLKPFSRRFQLPRRFFDRITQICIAQRWFQMKKHKRFRPTSFVKRNFFEETLALASLYLPNEDPEWQSNRDKWRSRILSAELSRSEQHKLLFLLQYKPSGSRSKRRRKRPGSRPASPVASDIQPKDDAS